MEQQHEELNELKRIRREKLVKLREMGINPYPYGFQRTHTTNEVHKNFDELEGKKIAIKDMRYKLKGLSSLFLRVIKRPRRNEIITGSGVLTRNANA